jgi:hypothetical protein
MTTIEQITAAVKRLPKKDLARFRKWFAEYDAVVWDQELEQDVAAGRLDALAREALGDYLLIAPAPGRQAVARRGLRSGRAPAGR